METLPSSHELQKKIGENIEYIRLLQRKTVKEMMAHLKLTESGYRNIERGITNISVTKLFHIASILNVQSIELLYGKEKSTPGKKSVPEEVKKHIEEKYEIQLQHFKKENNYLKKRIEVLETLLQKGINHLILLMIKTIPFIFAA